MPMFKVKVTQRFSGERVITLDIESDCLEGAVEELASGSTDVPDNDDPRWETEWHLRDEKVEPSDED